MSTVGKQKIVVLALVGLTLVWIWGNSLLPAEASRAISGSVQSLIDRILGLPPGGGIGGEGLLRKIAHMAEFAILGTEIAILFSFFAREWNHGSAQFFARKIASEGEGVTNRFLRLTDSPGQTLKDSNRALPVWAAPMLWILCGLLVALIDESIQIWSPGRAAMIQDVWIDMAGFVIGGMLILPVKGLVNMLRKVRRIRE